jgi:hypothetical protein
MCVVAARPGFCWSYQKKRKGFTRSRSQTGSRKCRSIQGFSVRTGLPRAYRASIQVFDPTSLGRLAPNVIQERDPHGIWPGHIEVPGDKPFNKVGRAHARAPHECDCRPAWELAPNNVSSNLIVNRDAPPFQNPELGVTGRFVQNCTLSGLGQERSGNVT